MRPMEIHPPATVEDLRQMPRDSRIYEPVDGATLMSPAGMRHSEVTGKILVIIAAYLEQHPVGKVYPADVGIALPDVTFVRHEKPPGGRSPKAMERWFRISRSKCGAPIRSDTAHHTAADVITAEPVLPGFSCRVGKFF